MAIDVEKKPDDIFSGRFNDVYFSRENGLAETRHVFLDANDLPARWMGQADFTVCELGFGTGLNFIVAAELFQKTAGQEGILNFISIEKYPLEARTIQNVLRPLFGDFISPLIRNYPLRTPGFHRVHFAPNIYLTLIFDDVLDALKNMDFSVDCWFLDGFTPSLNPDMWQDDVFVHMARLSHSGTTYSTFTAAGFVRRGLQAAGFEVEKVKGFGRKRDMIRGRFLGNLKKQSLSRPRTAAIIGGGMAGALTADALSKRGMDVTVLEAANCLASGASGNTIGMLNPRPFAMRGIQNEYHAMSFNHAVRFYRNLAHSPDTSHDIGFRPCGSLHLCIDDKRERRFAKALSSMGWSPVHMSYVSAREASSIANMRLEHDAMYFPDAAIVNPLRMVTTLLCGRNVHLNAEVGRIEHTSGVWRTYDGADNVLSETDVLVLANAMGVCRFLRFQDGVLKPLAGEVMNMRPPEHLAGLRTTIIYDRYISPSVNGTMQMGATFHRDMTAVPYQNSMQTRHTYERFFERTLRGTDINGFWSSYRTTTPDKLPLIGSVSGRDNLYVSAAYGSHGMIGASYGAEYLADMICGTPSLCPVTMARQLAPARYMAD